MSFLEKIRPFKEVDLSGFVPVLIAGQEIGQTKADFAKVISEFDHTWNLTSGGLELSSEFETFDDRTNAVDATFVALSEAGILPTMPDYSAFGGIDWYPVRYRQNAVPLLKVKRFYAINLGIQYNAVFLNGYHNGQYWLAKRGNVHEDPGMLDVITGGSTRYGESTMETLTHEAYEEAGLSEEELQRALPAGSIYLKYLTGGGFLRHEHFHLFDIDLKDRVLKINHPLEVAGFESTDLQQLYFMVEKGQAIKPQINLVLTDFLIRHGILGEAHPEFDDIKELLYRPTE